ncbi:aldo/keto reductase [Streptomyces marincola]|uniref:aldo/keto reductase n=1 Tax=Streptomyces marincola TaxID=2878388 RepID=UPI001CF31045|nr:aldo/keto reductase [Streptomyces marincola]UCM88166.1 aldo/keto reductase [Streptomyces marincola]
MTAPRTSVPEPRSAQAPRPTFAIGGRTPVRRLGFGAMRLADGPVPLPHPSPVWRPPAHRAHALNVLRRAVELGVELVDTADAYSLGGNEELVAEALHPYPERLLIATKCGVARPSPGEWTPLGRPEYLRQQAELSLRRLRVETLGLLQLHRIDPQVPLADQVGALRQLQEEGKVAHIGLSEVSVREIEEASAVAPIAAVQNQYNFADRRHDDVVDHCERHGIAFLPFFPMALGDHARPGGRLGRLAAEVGATPAQVALAWLLYRSPTVLPIPGTSSEQHLAENMGAWDVRLDDARLRELDAPA